MLEDNTLLFVASILAIVFGGWYLIDCKKKINARRERAGLLATKLAADWGLVRIPHILTKYSTGAYAQFLHELHELFGVFLHGEKVVYEELAAALERVLEAKAKTVDGKAWLVAKMAALTTEVKPA